MKKIYLKRQVFPVTIANIITIIRFVFIFPIIYFISYEQWNYAIIFFITAIITDFVDGTVARIRNECTHIGALLDAGTDKFLIMSIFFVFMHLHDYLLHIPSWLYYFIFFKEGIQMLLTIFLYLYMPYVEIKPRLLGKITMLLYSFFIFVLLESILYGYCKAYINTLCWVLFICGFLALCDYAIFYTRLIIMKQK